MRFKILTLAFIMAATFVSAQDRFIEATDINAVPDIGESELFFVNANDHTMAITVDGQLWGQIDNRGNGKIIVPDGSHQIQAYEYDMNTRTGQWKKGETTNKLNVNLYSNRVQIDITFSGPKLKVSSTRSLNNSGGVAAAAESGARRLQAATAPAPAGRYSSQFVAGEQQPVPPPAPARQPSAAPTRQPAAAAAPARSNNQGNIEKALNTAAAEIMASLAEKSTVAVLSIASDDKEQSEFVIDELAYLLVDSRKYKVVDRKSLDAIQEEQKFQRSGDVDDKSAVSIGKKLGASIVITGSVGGTGNLRRLRLKALDVKTAEIITMASERF